jgi:hypothetical protein
MYIYAQLCNLLHVYGVDNGETENRMKVSVAGATDDPVHLLERLSVGHSVWAGDSWQGK